MASHEDHSITSLRTNSGSDSPDIKVLPDRGIRRMGYLKKLKTMKKKFFVLRESAGDKPAQLEYFDAQKKYEQGHAAKRSVPVSGCFAVNKKEDCEQKYAISIFTAKETFTIVANSEREQTEWLTDLRDLRHAVTTGPLDGSPSSEDSQVTFDYVWNVDIQKDVKEVKGLTGLRRLCLLNRTLKIYALDASPGGTAVTFALTKLRTIGHNKQYFYIEAGRQAPTGSGKFCLKAEDVFSAQHMHDVISEEMRKGVPADENASASTGGRTRSNTDSRPRTRDGESIRRNTEGAYRDRQAVVPESDMGVRAGSDLTPGSGGSKERLMKLAEQRIPEYTIPDFRHSTSVEENYLPVDMDPAYYPCDYQPKVMPADAQLNYSAVTKVAEVPRGSSSTTPTLPAVQESPRTRLSPSIPEELGDYIPVTMPSHSRVASASVPVSSPSQPTGSNSSEESGYFEMNLPPKTADMSKSPPPGFMALHERLPPLPEVSPGSAYIMMAPSHSCSTGLATAGTGHVTGPSTSSDSRRSTMSNMSYQSHPSDRDEHNEPAGSEVTYAVMAPVASSVRRENSSREASTSSLGSSFGWERYSSFGSKTDYRLEKVKAFMANEDQDHKFREGRAYSTGCHPSKPTSSFKPDLPAVPKVSETFRTRAYSLGNHSSSPSSSTRATRPRGLIHSPSATMVLGAGPGADVRGEIRLISASDNQLTPPDASGRSTPSAEIRRIEGGNRGEDLMELTFRPRSGSATTK